MSPLRNDDAVNATRPFVPTGSPTFDDTLGGGLPSGALIMVQGPGGVGSTEFALTVLHAARRDGSGREAVFATALRTPDRVARELAILFEDEKAGLELDVVGLRPARVEADVFAALSGRAAGDVLVIESASVLHRAGGTPRLFDLLRQIGDAAAQSGVLVILLHATGSLPSEVEALLEEAADGVIDFSWRESGNMRRRALTVVKLRGLAPVLNGEHVPVFEVALERGMGFALSRVKNVL